MSPSPTAAASLPPAGLEGLDAKWSRLVTALDSRGVERTWHVLDNRVAKPRITLVCVHGNPTWSYLWRSVLAAAPRDVRVVAVDHLDMGFSERTGQTRRLGQRIDDLDTVIGALGINSPVVVVAHDWGGPISLGWAGRHRSRLAGVVLMNTAVHQPAGSPTPRLIRMARSPGILETLCTRTTGFIKGTVRLSKKHIQRPVRAAYLAPYTTAARRRAIATFVADIPLEADHPSSPALDDVAASLACMDDLPALLLWGSSDPVFSDLYLRDLAQRLPGAAVHRYPQASHLLPEEVDVATPIFRWLETLDEGAGGYSAPVSGQPLWAAIERRHEDDAVAVAEMKGAEMVRSVSFAELAAAVAATAGGMAAAGIRRGDRVALLVPPGVDLTVCLYACWRLGAVVVIADAGLGPRGMTQALESAAPSYLIGVRRAILAARSLRWPGKRISVDSVGTQARRALGIWKTLDELEELGREAPMPEPPGADDVAIVAFTSGATGPAKGVTYRHHQARANRDAIAALYAITEEDRLVAAFGPFALYGAALGITSVVPDMEITSPGTLTATALAGAAAAVDATLVFASPAALRNIVATAHNLTPQLHNALSSTRLLMSAGAPVPARLLREVAKIVPNAELHTPYGMTEVLPVADISLTEIESVGTGDGVCVGRPVAGVEVAISPLDADGNATGPLTIDPEVVGEVCIRAAHVKDEYDKLWVTQQASAHPVGWHRSGDVGHLDDAGCLWIEGRLIHVIKTAAGVVTPVAIEHAAEGVAGVAQAAAVGIGPAGTQQVILVLVPDVPPRRAGLADFALADAVRGAIPVEVAAVLAVAGLPVDKRHNSKINRPQLSQWAASVLAGNRIERL